MVWFAWLAVLLPGLVWLLWFSNREKRPWFVRADSAPDLAGNLADAVGVSLAAGALVGLATFLFKFSLSPAVLLGGYGFLAGLVLYALLSGRGGAVFPLRLHASSILKGSAPLLLFGLVLAWRFYQVRDLVLPAWVDSLHHTQIVSLILEKGAVPESFVPEMPVPFYYHFGFHFTTALFAFLSRLVPEQAVLVLGQELNAVVALAVYRLGMVLWSDWRRACTAMLLVGFVFQMPAYYATWGRYTLLSGLILMALAMAAALEIARTGSSHERTARLALFTGGVLLTHYFAAVLLALFLIVLFGVRTLFGRDEITRLLYPGGRKGLVTGALIGGAAASPWILRVWSFSHRYMSLQVVSPWQSLDEAYYQDYLRYLWYLLGPQRSHVLLGVAIFGLVLVGWQPGRRSLAVWTGVFALLSLPWGVHLNLFRPDHGMIVAFFTASLLVADTLFSPLGRISKSWLKRFTQVLCVLSVVGLLIWGLKETGQIINPITILASEPDLEAMDWIKGEIPQESSFFINVTLWQGATYRGVDGGWWIDQLTGRETLLPSAMYVFGDRDYVLGVNSIAERASKLTGCSPEFWELVRAAGVTHLYLHEGRGSLQPEELDGCDGVGKIYSQGGVDIYLLPPPSFQ